MTDKEPLERFVAEYGRGHVLGPYDRTRYGGKWKNMYVLSYGSFEDVQALIALMWSRLSPRRKEQAKEVLRAVQK